MTGTFRPVSDGHSLDMRYSIDYDSKASPKFVARFNRDVIGESDFYTSAAMSACMHACLLRGANIIVEQRA